jgi:hypothetical protein
MNPYKSSVLQMDQKIDSKTHYSSTKVPDSIVQTLDHLFEEMIEHQRNKVLLAARTRRARLTDDDVLNPNDFSELMADPIFNYEEGLASGLMAAHIAVRAALVRLEDSEKGTLPL